MTEHRNNRNQQRQVILSSIPFKTERHRHDNDNRYPRSSE